LEPSHQQNFVDNPIFSLFSLFFCLFFLIENDPFIFNIDDLLEQEPISSSNMFILPSIEKSSSSITYSIKEQDQINETSHRTLSSSSFLQETKQLLEMISVNQNFDLSKLVSEV
jgi:hypothetical protein